MQEGGSFLACAGIISTTWQKPYVVGRAVLSAPSVELARVHGAVETPRPTFSHHAGIFLRAKRQAPFP